MSENIKTVGGRKRLPIDADRVVWVKHATGQFIGFRKTDADAGTWWIRVYDPATRKQHYRQLGDLGGHTPARQYDEAMRQALEWFRSFEAGVVPNDATVADVCRQHVKALRLDDGDAKANETNRRFERYVYDDPIGPIPLSKLRRAHMEDWRRRLAGMPAVVWRRKTDKVKARNRPGRSTEATRERSAATVNRDMVPVRAALNRALDDGLVSSDLAWRVALRPTKGAGSRRDIYLERDDRRQLIDAATPEIRPFLRGLSLLPLRPGALAALTVGDFDARRRTLRIGKDKAGADRRITLPADTSAFFAAQVKLKHPAAPIFADGAGRAWTKITWAKPIKAAVSAAGFPANVTAYVLRHSTITDLVTGGLDLLTIAQISGTSVAMIERHYGHLRQDHAAAALAALAL